MQAKWTFLVLTVAAALALLGALQAAAGFIDDWSCADMAPGGCYYCCLGLNLKVHPDSFRDGRGCICWQDL